LVPAGCFQMGSTDEQVEAAFQSCESVYGTGQCVRSWFEAEQPVHQVCFEEPFWVDRYEVSQGQFAAFNGQAEEDSYFQGISLPRENVTWTEAQDFCEQRGARLPTEAEWEYAARGPEGWAYPWGNDFDGTLLNFCDENCTENWRDAHFDDGYEYPSPVGRYSPGGDSWVGAADLAGNGGEWTGTLYRDYPYDAGDGREEAGDTTNPRVVRGGGWDDSQEDARAAWHVAFGY